VNLNLAIFTTLLMFHDNPSRVQAVGILDIMLFLTKIIPGISR
jgi:hypothetical protein